MPLRLLKKRASCSSSSVANLHVQQDGNACKPTSKVIHPVKERAGSGS
jgi:hypothetical protein